MDSCTESIGKNIGATLINSGHSIFQLGQYYDCLETEGFRYNLVYMGYNNAYSGMFGGLCLPDACSKDIISDTINGLMVMAEKPYSVLGIIDDIEDYRFPFTWVFFVTAIIICSMIGIVMFSSLSKSKNKFITSVSMQKTMKIF